MSDGQKTLAELYASELLTNSVSAFPIGYSLVHRLVALAYLDGLNDGVKWEQRDDDLTTALGPPVSERRYC